MTTLAEMYPRTAVALTNYCPAPAATANAHSPIQEAGTDWTVALPSAAGAVEGEAKFCICEHCNALFPQSLTKHA
jgi:hypothetical protein